MFNANWNSLFSNGSLLAQSEGGGSLNILTLAGIAALAALALVAVAAVIAIHTWLSKRERPVSLRSAASHLLGLIWLLPIAAVGLLVVLPVFYWSLEPRPDVETPHDVREIVSTHDEAGEIELLATVTVPARETVVAEPVAVAPAELRPDWTHVKDMRDGERRLVVVESEQYPDVASAEQSALSKAVRLVFDDFEQTHPTEGGWTLNPPVVEQHALVPGKRYVEEIERTTGVNEFTVYRVYRQVELSHDVREAVYPEWRNQVVESRTWMLGGMLGFITLAIGTAAAYFRIDNATGGNYRRRLKFASVSLVAAGGLGIAALWPMVT